MRFRKILFFTFSLFAFYILAAVSCVFSRRLAIRNPWGMLGIGVLFLVLNAILLIPGKRYAFASSLAFFSGAVGMGFCLSAWHLYRGYRFELRFWLILAAAFAAAFFLILLISAIPGVTRRYPGFFYGILCGSASVYLILLFSTKTTWLSTVGFSLIPFFSVLYFMGKPPHNAANEWQAYLRSLSLSTLSVFAVAVLVALLMLSGDGDIFDFVDLSPESPVEGYDERKYP